MLVTKSKWAIAPITVLFLSEGFAADKPEPLFTSGFEIKRGTECVYKINHNGNKAEWKYQVAKTEGNDIEATWVQVSPDPSVSVSQAQAATANGLSVTIDLSLIHGTPMTLEPGIQWLAFPLEPKTKWETESEVAGTNAKGEPWKVKVSASYQAKKWEKVKVAAGKTMALRVDQKGRIEGLSGSFSGTENHKMWVGQGPCPVKKIEYRNSFKERAKLELVSESAP